MTRKRKPTEKLEKSVDELKKTKKVSQQNTKIKIKK